MSKKSPNPIDNDFSPLTYFVLCAGGVGAILAVMIYIGMS